MDNDFVDVDLLFETSWEVCNKVGGIYTVLSTKAKTLQTWYKNKVVFIGPDVWTESSPSPYFIEDAKVLASWRKNCKLSSGVTVRVGRWDIPGKPIAVLVKFDSMYAHKDEFYGMMWNKFGVDSLHAYGDYDEACAFSLAAGMVIESIYHHLNCPTKRVIAHFDEWTTGMGLLYTKLFMPQVATIFTTHATSIGRSICGNGKPLYDYMMGYNGDQMAGELNMQSKHSLEKAAAHQADCFTTVSDITARECAQLLERTPDVVTPNGFEDNFVPSQRRFGAVRDVARKRLLDVAKYLTGCDYADDTFVVITSGRSEYRNKGLDMFLDAMNTLRRFDCPRRVLSFIMVPAWCEGARADLQWAMREDIKSGLPLNNITHNLHDTNCDRILSRVRELNFTNTSGDTVSVVYVPCYLNGNDGIFNLSYYDLLIGADATVFPSYYEPWGYTPLESVAFHVPTVTTSLSGFGAWILSNFTDDFESCGVNVVERTDSNYGQAVDSIARDINFLVNADESVMKHIRNAARDTAKSVSWQEFMQYYEKAFAIALENENIRNTK